MSMRVPQLPIGASMGREVEIRQKKKERDDAADAMNTRSYMDQPVSVTVHPATGETIVAMQSGKVWRTDGGSWHPVCWWPVPDSPAAEDADELRRLNTELSNLGYQEED